VTGPQALTWFDVANTMSEILGRSITHYPTSPGVIGQALLAMGRPPWLVEHMLELGAPMHEPKAAEVTDTVERITGRPAATLREFLSDHAPLSRRPRECYDEPSFGMCRSATSGTARPFECQGQSGR
jgi:hypothetical protein